MVANIIGWLSGHGSRRVAAADVTDQSHSHKDERPEDQDGRSSTPHGRLFKRAGIGIHVARPLPFFACGSPSTSVEGKDRSGENCSDTSGDQEGQGWSLFELRVRIVHGTDHTCPTVEWWPGHTGRGRSLDCSLEGVIAVEGT